jgi:hypothetical protein
MERSAENKTAIKKNLSQLMTYLVLATSLGYLIYQLYHFEHYEEFGQTLSHVPRENIIWLVWVVLLLPLNQLTEALKWKTMTGHIEKISLTTALKAVLAGAATGFITLNRIGDIFGRTRFLKPENRIRALSLAITGSVTQNLAIILPGIPALIFFLRDSGSVFGISNTHLLLFYSITATILLLTLPIIISVTRQKQTHKLHVWLSGLNQSKISDLIPVLLLAFVRFGISCVQLWMFLQFAGISLTPAEALKSIFVSYLFITFTPSFALSEGIVRASVAMFFIGFYAGNNPAIALAGAGLWLINVVLPVFAGNIILFNSRRN